jgi:hypothetical protein
MADGTLYLLPYDSDARDAVGIKTTALSVDAFKGELTEIAKHGRVLVLLDFTPVQHRWTGPLRRWMQRYCGASLPLPT